MVFPRPLHIGFSALLLAIGALCGWLLSQTPVPLPYMLASLIVSAALTMAFQQHFPAGYAFPIRFRQLFVGVIGVMIGAQVHPDVLAMIPSMAVSIPMVLLFVVLAHGGNYLIFRRGGYDRPTAFYSGSPGGLIESITFGEEAGADVRILTLMQFLRIIVVVSILPIGISIYEGAPVGSAAGLGGNGAVADVWDVILACGLAVIGVMVGEALRIPAGQLVGPLAIVGVASGFGWLDLTLPPWLIASAQVVLGVGLGLRFRGITRRMLLAGLGLSISSVLMMLALGVGFACVVHWLTGLSVETMIISFAPGGVTEMSLVALSLAMSPAFVTMHHLIRIIATVLELVAVRKLGWLSAD
ncbi:AbrB family transcriptional regulator [Maritimibacter sp. DP1N21-5]|uniref:AbrB family transcriptional regulator n=1 Tax=Maritimibacter sp. DP1N21-5 TaxID=2836867 RepID=UPI001C45DA1D|nr:AbrB family transcriptional regulator [Maritimibacter sp. DP1N21-5]MBV7409338.1 AbrB family transcriptional regulator [Maritimibacter sp. DP1N21-5]